MNSRPLKRSPPTCASTSHPECVWYRLGWRTTRGVALGILDALPQHLGGTPVPTGHGVRVDIQRRRCPSVGEAGGDDRHWDAFVEHLGRHEMPEVVESEVVKTGGKAGVDEPFGHVVRITASHCRDRLRR